MNNTPSFEIEHQKTVYFLGIFFVIVGLLVFGKSTHIFFSFMVAKKDHLTLMLNSLACMLSGFTFVISGFSIQLVLKKPIEYFREIRSRNVIKLSKHQVVIVAPLFGWTFYIFFLTILPKGDFVLSDDSIQLLMVSFFAFVVHLPLVYYFKKRVESHRRRME